MKILIVTTSLACGGITSFLIPFTNYLCDIGHEVDLLYTKDEGNYVQRLNKDIRLITFQVPSSKQWVVYSVMHGGVMDLLRLKFRDSKKSAHISALQRLQYLRAECAQLMQTSYDVAISSAEFFCNAYVAKKVTARKKIGWVHPDLSTLNIDVAAANEIVSGLHKIVAVSKPGQNYLQSVFSQRKEDILYIRNMLDENRIQARSLLPAEGMDTEAECLKIVTVCRIENTSKRLDRVVSIAKHLTEKDFDFCWYLIGEGIDSSNIQNMIQENRLDSHVIMLGKRENPYPYIKNADVFVLTSQYEGMPIVIEEAKVLHTPVVTTAYSSAYEQLENYGVVIVENRDETLVHEIADALMSSRKIEEQKEIARMYCFSGEIIKQQIRDLISIGTAEGKENNDSE